MESGKCIQAGSQRPLDILSKFVEILAQLGALFTGNSPQLAQLQGNQALLAAQVFIPQIMDLRHLGHP